MPSKSYTYVLSTMALLSAASAHGLPQIVESFDYADGVDVDNLNGGQGFAETWRSTRRNPSIYSPGLDWGPLSTTGNAARGQDWSGLSRVIDSSLANAGLLNNGSSLWFSTIIDYSVTRSGTSGDLGFTLGSAQKFHSGDVNHRFDLEGATSEGVGFTVAGSTIQGAYWQDAGDGDTRAEGTFANSSLSITSGAPRAQIVGHIQWGQTNTANETLTLYAPSATAGALGTPIFSSMSLAAMDQSSFDTLSIMFKEFPLIDEIRFGGFAKDVAYLPDELRLRVNTTNGRTTLIGDNSTAVAFNYYEVTSDGDSLSTAEWNSLADKDFDGNGPADGSGDGWEELGGSDASSLAEGFLLGNSTLAADQEVDLGIAYDTSVDVRDLTLRFLDESLNAYDGVVEYFSPLMGDANDDGSVDGADLAILAASFGSKSGENWDTGDFSGDGTIDGSDLALLAANFGQVSAVSQFSASAVPEPTSLTALGLGVLLLGRHRRR